MKETNKQGLATICKLVLEERSIRQNPEDLICWGCGQQGGDCGCGQGEMRIISPGQDERLAEIQEALAPYGDIKTSRDSYCNVWITVNGEDFMVEEILANK